MVKIWMPGVVDLQVAGLEAAVKVFWKSGMSDVSMIHLPLI
jgi:hypothetical protein